MFFLIAQPRSAKPPSSKPAPNPSSAALACASIVASDECATRSSPRLHLDIRTLLRAIAQVWLAQRGEQALTLSDQTNAASIESRELGCWLCEVLVGGQKRVRLATDPQGNELVLTAEEAAQADAEAARTRNAPPRGRR
jgi:hypothetical protein